MARLRYIPNTPEMLVLLSLLETPYLPVNSRTAKRLSKFPCYACVLVEGLDDPRRWQLTERGHRLMDGLKGWIEAFKYGEIREAEIRKMRWPPDGIQPGIPHRGVAADDE